MTAICPTCHGPARLDRDLIRCDGCGRTALCRCRVVAAARKPLWLERANQKRNGLARDFSEVA